MSNIKQFLRVLLFVAAGSLGATGFAFAADAPPPAPAAPSSNVVPPGTVMSDLALGSAKAPVTVIEYASFTCPHCREFYDATFPEVKAKLIDTGKIRYIYRDFPLDRLALRASMLARCSGPQNYYGYVDVLFKQQLSWATADKPLDALRELARLGGMSDGQFKSCMDSKPVEQAVLKSRLDAQKEYDVNATPSFIINGVKYAGAMSYDQFYKLIAPLLPKTSGDAAPAANPKVAAAAPSTPATSNAVTTKASATPAPAAAPAAAPAVAKPADPPRAAGLSPLLKGVGIAIVVVVLGGIGRWAIRRKGRA